MENTYRKEIMELNKSVAELAVISRSTEKTVDELRGDVKQLNKIVTEEMHNSKNIKTLETQVSCIDKRLLCVENKDSVLAKRIIKKVLYSVGLLFLGGVLVKLEVIVGSVFKWLSS